MRRPTRFGLAVAILLIVATGGYSVFWFAVAHRLRQGIGLWAQSLRTRHLDLSWRTARVTGFPFAFRLVLSDATVRDSRRDTPGEVRLPLLSASAVPWNFRVWHLAAPEGLAAAAGPKDRPLAQLAARSAEGSIVVAGQGATLWFGVNQPTAEAGVQLAARHVFLWLILPPRPPQGQDEPALGVALEAQGVRLPVVPPPFHNPLDEVSFGVTVKGEIPEGPPRQAAAAWRDAGGGVEFNHLAVRWGALAIHGSGTLALDSELQPEGAFSGGVEGYPELMRALVASGRIRAEDAGLAGLALAFLSKKGPSGRPEISLSFTVQNGKMYLGPAPIGPAPRIDWR